MRFRNKIEKRQFVKRILNDVQDDVMRDAKLS